MSEHADTGTRFVDMPFTRKITWTLKFIAALATFGFAFPNVMHD